MAESTRLRTYVEFDPVKDSEALTKANRLVDNRQFASFVSNIVKVVLNNPDLMNNIDAVASVGNEYKEKHITELIDKVLKLEEAITELNEEVLLLKEFIKLRKVIGIEQKVDNVLSADLLIKRQIRKLNQILGKTGTDLIIDSKYIQEDFTSQNKRAEDVVAFAIEYYDGIISELRETVKVREVEAVREIEKPKEEHVEHVEQTGTTGTENKKDEKTAKIASTTDASAALTDEDMDAMGAFFGL